MYLTDDKEVIMMAVRGTRHGTPDARGTAHPVPQGTPDAAARGTVQLSTAQAAARLGIAPATLRGYIKDGTAPPPDGWHDKRTRWWWATTIDAYKASRPGQGARTDLAKPEPARGDHIILHFDAP